MVTTLDVLHFEVTKFSESIFKLKQNNSVNHSHINPSSKDWGSYLAYKRETSLLYTAINIVKRFGNNINIKEAKSLKNHCTTYKGKSKKLVIKAIKLIKKINNRIDKAQKTTKNIAYFNKVNDFIKESNKWKECVLDNSF